LTNFKALIAGFPHWSPDGAKIAFHLRDQSQASIVVQDVRSDRSKRLTSGFGNDASPSWSHDGNWIYFCSERNGGDQIWRVPAEGGPAKQVTTHGGLAPEESADGRYLFYTKTKQNDIWRMSVSGNKEEQVVANVAGTTYALGKHGIYFIALPNGGIRQHLAFLNFATGGGDR
jgi:Tol biopolymer transport system component